ncbi:MAG: UDP-N-acetylmuramate dehydrogenase [Patescibacteria group bacterium]
MKFLENISLAEYTTFRIGGKARYFCVVKSEEDLREALDFAKGNETGHASIPFFVLGSGSNILVSDEGFPGLVIKMEMMGVSFEKKDDGVFVTVSAGQDWDKLVIKTVGESLWGLENLSGIPGTVGAAPVQNIGAYGAEAKDVIISVCAVDTTTSAARIFTNTECQFSYRESFFKTTEGKKYVITNVTFKLSQNPKPNLSYRDLKEYFERRGREKRELMEHGSFLARKLPRLRRRRSSGVSINSLFSRPLSLSEIRKAVIEIRKRKFPELSKVGTAGSFWKNPIISPEHFAELKAKYPNIPSFSFDNQVKVPLAWILDNVCKLKGYTKGPTGLWKNQPLVVIAEKGAFSSDIKSFAIKVANIVKEKTDIDIEKEVQYIG